MLWIDILSRVIHVLTAITLVGGSLFTLLVLMPSAKELSDEAHDTLASAIGSRWKKFVHGGVALFLISGIYNYVRAIPSHEGDGLYHALVGTKMILAMVVFFLAAALVGRSPKLQPIRDARPKSLRLLVGLALVIVCLSGFVKVRGVPGPPSESSPPVETP